MFGRDAGIISSGRLPDQAFCRSGSRRIPRLCIPAGVSRDRVMSEFELLLTVLTNVLGFVLPCLGYIDPGSGSLMLQLILAGAASLFVMLKYTGGRLRDVLWPFGKNKQAATEASPAASNDAEADQPSAGDSP